MSCSLFWACVLRGGINERPRTIQTHKGVYIDREAAQKQVDKELYMTESEKEYTKSIIRKVLAADVAPVVRCKDCVYYRQTEDWDRRKYKACHLLAHIIIHKTKPGDFCSFGEKVAGGAEDG